MELELESKVCLKMGRHEFDTLMRALFYYGDQTRTNDPDIKKASGMYNTLNGMDCL